MHDRAAYFGKGSEHHSWHTFIKGENWDFNISDPDTGPSSVQNPYFFPKRLLNHGRMRVQSDVLKLHQ